MAVLWPILETINRAAKRLISKQGHIYIITCLWLTSDHSETVSLNKEETI